MLDNPRFILLLFMAVFLSALMYYDRKNVQRTSILFFRRTKKGLDLIDKIAKTNPRFWSIYGWIGLIVGAISVFVAIYYIGLGFVDLAQGGEQGGVGLVLPGLSGEQSFQPGAFFIPIEYWIISIGIIMFVHELSHGIVARAEDFEINSVGWLVLGIIPGAFVEPKGENMLPGAESGETQSEEHHGPWDQGNWKSQLKVLSAGSFANYVTAAIFILLLFGMQSVAYLDTGLHYNSVEDSPAEAAGMTSGILYSLDNITATRNNQEFVEAVFTIEPGDEVHLNTSEGEFTVTAEAREEDQTNEQLLEEFGIEERGYLGLEFNEYKEGYQPYESGLGWFMNLLLMIGLLNFAIGLFNMLPIKPLDGGQIVDVLTREYVSEEATTYVNYLSLIGWILIVGSILYGLIIL